MAGSYAKVLLRDEVPAAYAQFGPLTRLPAGAADARPLSGPPGLRRCPPSSPASPRPPRRATPGLARRLVEAVCDDLRARGFTAVETYPEVGAGPDATSAATPGVLGVGRVRPGDRRRPLPGHAPRIRVTRRAAYAAGVPWRARAMLAVDRGAALAIGGLRSRRQAHRSPPSRQSPTVPAPPSIPVPPAPSDSAAGRSPASRRRRHPYRSTRASSRSSRREVDGVGRWSPTRRPRPRSRSDPILADSAPVARRRPGGRARGRRTRRRSGGRERDPAAAGRLRRGVLPGVAGHLRRGRLRAGRRRRGPRPRRRSAAATSYVGTCVGGARTYHTYLESTRGSSCRSRRPAPRRFGELIVAGLAG